MEAAHTSVLIQWGLMSVTAHQVINSISPQTHAMTSMNVCMGILAIISVLIRPGRFTVGVRRDTLCMVSHIAQVQKC